MRNLMNRTFTFVALASLLILSGCIDDATQYDLDGATLIGSFMRGGPLALPAPTQVVLNFGDGTFEGYSDNPKHPAICKGTYSQTGSTITFKNTCAFTADFDWTLILDGEYTYERDGNSIYIRRTYENENIDLYDLEISN